jgi:hypothetical protein
MLLLLPAYVCQEMSAQQMDLERKISLNFKGTLDNLLKEISDQAGIEFSYSPGRINAEQHISYVNENQTINEILIDLGRIAKFQYSVVNDYIVLKPAGRESAMRGRVHTIRGVITDSTNSEAMIGATVYIKETGTGTISNSYGFYSLTLPEGAYTLQSSFLGYSQQLTRVDLKKDIVHNFIMKQIPFTMKEIVISSVNNEKMVFSSLAGQTTIDPAQVQRQSAALGETDMLKALDHLPGISFQSDGSSYFSVRGGAHDQNLILLDDAPIFNPSHLLGLFTPIIPEAVKHTEVYKADFPVQFGGRLSSVVDIRTKDGNLQRFSGNASIGPVSTRFSLEGPFRKNSSSWFLSFRVSTFGLLVKAANPSVDNFYFTDFTSKFNFRLGPRDRIFITLFAGKDAFINNPGAIRNGLEWSNTTGTLRWSHIYGSRLFSNTTLYASKYDYSLYTNYDNKVYWNSDITSTNLKSEFTWYLNPRNSMRFGFNVSGYFFNPGNYLNSERALDTMTVSQVNSSEIVLYAGDEAELTRWMKLNIGFRISNWSNYGEAFNIVFDNDFNPVSRNEYAKGVRYFSSNFIEPRASLSLKTGKLSSVKISYNRTIQHISQINNTVSPLNALEVWLPSGPNLKPQYSDIYDLGFVKAWPAREIELSSDIYYKNLYNQLGYASHAGLFLNPYMEGELRQGKGYGYGFEIMLRKKSGRLTGMIGIGRSRSFLRIRDLNNNRWYRSHQDKPLDFSVSVDYRLGPRWTVNMNMVYTSGMALSTPSGFYYYRGKQVPYYHGLNNARLPAYRRIDLGSTWQLNKTGKTFQHFFNLSFYNFFNTHNYAFINFNKIEDSDNKYYIPADHLNPQRQINTYRYIYSIIPSFTYSLKF